jgi:hypothetical protein
MVTVQLLCIKADQVLICACDQGSPCSIYGKNMKPKDSSLGTFNLVVGLFATTVFMCNNEYFGLSKRNAVTFLTHFFSIISKMVEAKNLIQTPFDAGHLTLLIL